MNGGELEAINSDPVLHNIHIYALTGKTRRTVFSVSQPQKGNIVASRINVQAGVALKVECDAHNFMHAYVFVARSPYFAIVDREGRFEIGNLSPGRYVLKAWHPTLGVRSAAVEVTANGITRADFEY